MYSLKVEDLSKRFGKRKVFSDISFELKTGESIAIVGPNGSGKSTLLLTLLSELLPTKGSIKYLNDNSEMDDSQIRSRTSLVSPYLNLYENLSGEENLVFFSTVAGIDITGKEIEELLGLVGLEGRGIDLVHGYSSGMKQRLKYAAALLNEPDFIFLDEPTSNLDDEGKKAVFNIIEKNRENSIIIIATNESEEYQLAGKQCRVNQ